MEVAVPGLWADAAKPLGWTEEEGWCCWVFGENRDQRDREPMYL